MAHHCHNQTCRRCRTPIGDAATYCRPCWQIVRKGLPTGERATVRRTLEQLRAYRITPTHGLGLWLRIQSMTPEQIERIRLERP